MQMWEENMANSGLEPEQYSLVIDQDGFDDVDIDVTTHLLGKTALTDQVVNSVVNSDKPVHNAWGIAYTVLWQYNINN